MGTHSFHTQPVSPDVSGSRRERRQIPTKDGDVLGEFVIVAEHYAYVACQDVVIGTRYLAEGDLFLYDAQLSAKLGRTAYTRYRGIYRAIRANLTYAGGWAVMKRTALVEMHAIAKETLDAQYGRVRKPADVSEATWSIVRNGGKGFTTHKDELHAIELLHRTVSTTRRQSRRLGLSHAEGQLAARLQYVDEGHHLVVSLGTLLAEYVGGVLDVVRAARTEIDAIMGLATDAFFAEEIAHRLDAVQFALRAKVLVQPMVSVRRHAMIDLAHVALAVRRGAQMSKDGRSGASEGVRNLLGNVRDSLDLLLVQERLETEVTPPVGARVRFPGSENAAFNAEGVVKTACALRAQVNAPFGSRFANVETMPTIRKELDAGISCLDANDMRFAEAKAHFIAASDAVAGSAARIGP